MFIEWEEVEVSKASDKFFEITGIEVMTQRQAMREGLLKLASTLCYRAACRKSLMACAGAC